MKRIALLQMTSGISPAANCTTICNAIRDAAEGGAQMLFTPEMSGLLDQNRKRAAQAIHTQADDTTLEAVQAAAKQHGIWVALGSLAVIGEGGQWANRSFLITDHGKIAAKYDKMHMFDVELGGGDSWRESAAYKVGETPVAVQAPVGRLGLTICYDVRFPALFEALGVAQCDVIAVPAAFTRPTGRDHWHVLLRARAIEASAFIVAAAQVGQHEDGRATYGHSLLIDPWGDVLLDMGGETPGLEFADIDLERIKSVRAKLPSLANRRAIPNVHIR